MQVVRESPTREITHRKGAAEPFHIKELESFLLITK